MSVEEHLRLFLHNVAFLALDPQRPLPQRRRRNRNDDSDDDSFADSWSSEQLSLIRAMAESNAHMIAGTNVDDSDVDESDAGGEQKTARRIRAVLDAAPLHRLNAHRQKSQLKLQLLSFLARRNGDQGTSSPTTHKNSDKSAEESVLELWCWVKAFATWLENATSENNKTKNESDEEEEEDSDDEDDEALQQALRLSRKEAVGSAQPNFKVAETRVGKILFLLSVDHTLLAKATKAQCIEACIACVFSVAANDEKKEVIELD